MTEQTKLVDYRETSLGGLIIIMQRGNDKREAYYQNIGDDVWDQAQEYYLNLGWSEEQFENYWDDGGREKEIEHEVQSLVADYYDDPLIYQDLEKPKSLNDRTYFL